MRTITFLLFGGILFFYAGAAYSQQQEKKSVTTSPTAGVRSVVQSSTKGITGTVTDEFGDPLPGVSIVLKSNPKVGNVTDINGRFIWGAIKPGERLLLTFVGMEPYELVVKGGVFSYNIQMKTSANQLDEVVVETGIFQRDKVSFTGATSAYSGKELRTISSSNLIQSLKTLDPSFTVLDNSIMGSDPNTMATVELRGQGGSVLNSVKDEFNEAPNQPLFVLNGVEVPITRINDLDINRIESVTILKDAGSTAIYGSKGANGVVVVETIKPKAGELKVYYDGDFKFSAPDLSGYNMMNAAEKLEFERLSGKYTSKSADGTGADYQKTLTELYNSRLADIRSGVDTYWLSEPVQTGISQAHSIRVAGGSQFLSMDVGARYKDDQGVMKGSGRKTWAGNLDLSYRTEKLIISNSLDLNGFDATNSPYGSYSAWVNTSPYFKKTNADGSIDKYLQYKKIEGSAVSPITNNISNPLYNASLNSKDTQNEFYVSNSLQIQYFPTQDLRFKAGLDLVRRQNKAIEFTPPEHTKYEESSMYQKGEYFNKDLVSSTYRARFDVIYAKVFKLHSVAFNSRAKMEQSNSNYISTTAVGFPFNSQGTPNLAYSYQENSKPSYSQAKSRAVSLIGNFNYNYDKRYLFDFSVSVDGSSAFGTNRLYKSFWSTGVGWNIDREAFMAKYTWLDLLKVRGSVGLAGNQNMGRINSSTVYQYYVDSNIFGQGVYISTFGNPDLPWQITKDLNIGVDFKALKGRVSLTFDMFHKKNNPNVVNLAQIPSTGISDYPMALGHLTNQGVEFRVLYFPIYNRKERILWSITVTGSHNSKEYSGLGKSISKFNIAQQSSNTMRRYLDGHSPDDIWAVRSKGIDPATGEEVFIKKDGTLTFDYDADDNVVVGSSRPDLFGVISTSFRYKNFEVGMALRYSYGSEIYNSVLYNKVENITKSALEKNQDRRALYDRWHAPGDVAEYKAITILSAIVSPRTSRFVQKNNYLNAESINCRYDFINNPWLKSKLSISSLSITGHLNDIFRLQTSKTERSIDYPFARSFSFGLNIGF